MAILSEISGTIDHRILLNYRVDSKVMAAQLPAEFTPKLIDNVAIGGICQVSLSNMRPKGVPAVAGSHSHNAAHRIAVTSNQGEGVYIPRRDTDSWLNSIVGGKLFPGVYSLARFSVLVEENRYVVGIDDQEGEAIMRIDATIVDELPPGSVFRSTEAVSDFFRCGNIGWSLAADGKGFDAIELRTVEWSMQPLEVSKEYSSYFCQNEYFPAGSVEFDSAMIMRDIGHSWISKSELRELCC